MTTMSRAFAHSGSGTKGVQVDTVLGLAVTPTNVGLVLVEGRDGDGATIERDAFDVRSRRDGADANGCQHVAAAADRAQEIALASDYRPFSIGLTWSDDAETEASMLLESLEDSGVDNIVPIRLPEATEALARGIGQSIGYDRTAVCVTEPEAATVMIVDERDGRVQTFVNHAVHSEDGLVRWLTAIFDRHERQPDGLVVVGSGDDLDALMDRLEETLSVPVFAPAEAQLALARGAALASAQDRDLAEPMTSTIAPREARRSRPWPLSYAGALTLLIAGVLTFVVSVSVAVGLRLTADQKPAPVEHPQAPSAAPPVVQAVAPPALPPPPAAAPPRVETAVAPPPAETPAPEYSVPDSSPPAAVADHPSASVAPPEQPPVQPPVPSVQGTRKPPLLTRILGHMPGLHRSDPLPAQQAPAPQSPDQAPPPAPAPDAPPPSP